MRQKKRENLQYAGQMALEAQKPVKVREQSTENRYRFQAAKQRANSNAPNRQPQNLINKIRNINEPTIQSYSSSKTKIVKVEKSKNLIPSVKSSSLTTQNNQFNNATQNNYYHQRTDIHNQNSIQTRYNQSQQNFHQQSNQFEEKEKQAKLDLERKQEKNDLKIKNDILNENQNKLNDQIKLKQTLSKEETSIPLQVSSLQRTQLYQTRSEGVNTNSQIKSTNEQAKQIIKEQEKSKDNSSQARFVEISQKNTEDRRGSLTSAGKMASNTQQSNPLQINQQLEQANGTRPTNSTTKQYQTGISSTVNTYNQNGGGRRQQNLLEMKNSIGENKDNQKPDKQLKREEKQSSEEENQSDEEEEEEKKIEVLISQKNQKFIDKNPNQGLVGLANIGNTCFMNSILQCLLHTPDLAQYFCNDQYNNELNKKAKMKGELAKNYGEFVKSCKSSRNNSTVTPSQIKFLIGKYAPQFMGYAQQDSQELLRFLLDGLHEDLNRVKSKPTYRELPSDTRQIGKAQLAQM